MVVGKTRRGVGEGAGDQWVKPGDWEIACLNLVISIPN